MEKILEKEMSEFFNEILAYRQAKYRRESGILPHECLHKDWDIYYLICKTCGIKLIDLFEREK